MYDIQNKAARPTYARDTNRDLFMTVLQNKAYPCTSYTADDNYEGFLDSASFFSNFYMWRLSWANIVCWHPNPLLKPNKLQIAWCDFLYSSSRAQYSSYSKIIACQFQSINDEDDKANTIMPLEKSSSIILGHIARLRLYCAWSS